LLFAAGCGSSAKVDTDAAQELLRKMHSNEVLTIHVVEGPEYADIPRVPEGRGGKLSADKPAACGVRIKFTSQQENRTTHDDWVIWVSADHKAVSWVGNPKGDDWRPYVQSFAKK
jgi:hypothetical protein